jgi:hypothetical protein
MHRSVNRCAAAFHEPPPQLSMLEVYMERVRDLLDAVDGEGGSAAAVSRSGAVRRSSATRSPSVDGNASANLAAEDFSSDLQIREVSLVPITPVRVNECPVSVFFPRTLAARCGSAGFTDERRVRGRRTDRHHREQPGGCAAVGGAGHRCGRCSLSFWSCVCRTRCDLGSFLPCTRSSVRVRS